MKEFFLDCLNGAKCIEDILISSFGCIANEFNSKKEKSYCPEEYKEIQEIISAFFEQESYEPVHAMSNLKKRLKEMFLKKEFLFDDYYCIIRTIDANYHLPNYRINMGFSNYYRYSSLSNILKEPDVFLIPKFNMSYVNQFENYLINLTNPKNLKAAFRKKMEFDKNHINSYLKNVIFVEKKDIGNCKLNIFEYINDKLKKNNFITNIINKKTINFLIQPITNEKIANIFDIKNDDRFFWIEGIDKTREEKIAELYIKTIQDSLNKDVDFIVFPEMFLSEHIFEKVVEFLMRNNSNKYQVYILGSVWKDCSNKTIIIDSDGELIYEQYKKVAFEKNGIAEKLLDDNSIINILDFPNLIRLNTFICREIVDDKMMSIPKILESNLIIAPSFSESLNMDYLVKGLASNYFCTTIMANSCSARYDVQAIQNNKEIGFICQPAKRNRRSDCEEIYYNFEQKCEKCNYNCLGYSVTLNLNDVADYSNPTFNTIITKN